MRAVPARPAPAREPAGGRAGARDEARRGAAREEPGGGVEGLIHEFSLSSQEGVALMCLAEALLRIRSRDPRCADPRQDQQGRLALARRPRAVAVRERGDLGLMITGKLVTTNSEAGLSSALTRLIGRGGEPLIRKGVDMAMRLMGEQFVTGETISSAGEQPQVRSARLPLPVRHARRSGDDRRGRAALLRVVRTGDPRDARRPAAAVSTKARASRSSCPRCTHATRARSRTAR